MPGVAVTYSDDMTSLLACRLEAPDWVRRNGGTTVDIVTTRGTLRYQMMKIVCGTTTWKDKTQGNQRWILHNNHRLNVDGVAIGNK